MFICYHIYEICYELYKRILLCISGICGLEFFREDATNISPSELLYSVRSLSEGTAQKPVAQSS